MRNKKSTKRQSKTDWARIDAMRDEDIDYSDAPKLGPDFFANAIIWPGMKKQITLRIDPDVLTFFRKQGRGYQSAMNGVLRRYMEAKKAVVSVSLIAGPKDPIAAQEKSQLEPELQRWLNSCFIASKPPSSSALLPVSTAWLQRGRGRKVRFEIETEGKVRGKEVASVGELEDLIGAGKTPEAFLADLTAAIS
jgi:uncharacterized protein (DUF4415 family)